ncbi:unnamed protein product [Ilex paraguariensis]|uniref:Cytochrome b561 and DOMON domain-containing protein n=1 Tax=Ilex paraguariensis TaxID=185542 RepID=A0ABC8TFN1_9AQUA
MASTSRFLLLFVIISSLFFSPLAISLPSSTQSCARFVFPNKEDDDHHFASCVDLPVLNSFLYWTYYPSSSTVQICYRHTESSSGTWVAWGINPTSKGMVGTQALIAYQELDGTLKAYTSPINSYGTQLAEGELSLKVSDLSASYMDNEIAIFATLELPTNTTMINYLWQDGPVSSGNALGMHGLSGQHVQSMATLDLSSGTSVPTKGGKSKSKLRNIHGALNVISWGTMMPIGFMLARYLKVFRPSDPLWFYLHVSCQCLAFLIGVVGWATGLALRLMSAGVHHTDHIAIGTTVFSLGILQVLALRLRPHKDHKYRCYWNIYHHYVGYIVLALGIANVFIGYKILKPGKGWEIAYYVIFGALLFTLVMLEACKRLKKSANNEERNCRGSEVVGNIACPQQSV